MCFDKDILVFHSISVRAQSLHENPFRPLFGLKGRATVHTGTWTFNGRCLVYSIPQGLERELVVPPDSSFDELRTDEGWLALKKEVPGELEEEALAWLDKFDRTRIRGGLREDIGFHDIRYLPQEYLLAVLDCKTKGRQGRYFYPSILNASCTEDIDSRLLELRIKRRAYEKGSLFGPLVRKIPALVKILP